MGGFEGGDEGGFWDEDAIDTLIQKQNTQKSLKKEKISLVLKDGVYSVKGDGSFSLVPQECTTFTIEGIDSNSLESNAIYKAYKTLIKLTCDSETEEFFYEYKVVVTSSNASVKNFLLLVKELCNLVLSDMELTKIEETL